jgi:chromosome segregation ATPase
VRAKSLISIAMLALPIGAVPLLAQDADATGRFERLKAERDAAAAARREAQQRYEQGLREAAEARARYEAQLAGHNQTVQRAAASEAEYRRLRAEYEAQVGRNGDQRGRRAGGPRNPR